MSRAAELLNDLPALWRHPGVEDRQRQELIQETLEEVRIMGRELVAVRPKPQYAPHFAYLTFSQRYCLTGAGGTMRGTKGIRDVVVYYLECSLSF